MEKWEDKKNFVSLICVWFGGWKSRGMKKDFIWLRIKFV